MCGFLLAFKLLRKLAKDWGNFETFLWSETGFRWTWAAGFSMADSRILLYFRWQIQSQCQISQTESLYPKKPKA